MKTSAVSGVRSNPTDSGSAVDFDRNRGKTSASGLTRDTKKPLGKRSVAMRSMCPPARFGSRNPKGLRI